MATSIFSTSQSSEEAHTYKLTYTESLQPQIPQHISHPSTLMSTNWRPPQSAYALHILQNQHEYGQMNSTMTLLKPRNNPSLILPYVQYYIQSLHQEDKLIPEQSPGETNPLSKWSLIPNPHIPHEQASSASACIWIPHHHSQNTT